MKRRTWLLGALFVLLWSAPANADNRIIVRTTLGLQGLQQLCLLQTCTVVGGLGDVQNELFLLTTPLDPTTFLGILRSLPGIVNAELDQLAFRRLRPSFKSPAVESSPTSIPVSIPTIRLSRVSFFRATTSPAINQALLS